MQKIIPHLWFDYEALKAVQLYSQAIQQSSFKEVNSLDGTPSGEVQILDFTLGNVDFQAINAGPYFHFNTTSSLMVILESVEEVDQLYAVLVDGGEILMPLQKYDFSERYAWISDRFGLHWQLMYVESEELEKRKLSRVRPCLLFSGLQRGNAEKAMKFYETIFAADDTAKRGVIAYTPSPEPKMIDYAELTLMGLELVLMDNAFESDQSFNESFSLILTCDTQEEIDRYWDALSSDPDAEQCGWLKDPFGVSWQIVPSRFSEYMKGPKEAVERVTQAFLAMKKFDISALEAAYKGD